MRGVTCGPPMINTPEKWPFLHFEFDMPDLLESTDRLKFPFLYSVHILMYRKLLSIIKLDGQINTIRLIYHISDFHYFSPSQIPLAKEQHLDTFKIH